MIGRLRSPSRLILILILTALVALALATVLGDRSGARADTAAAGNAFYKVYMENTAASDGIGTYTAATGPSHPVGEDANVLFGGSSADAWSSYNTIRSYTTDTDYVQTTNAPASSFTVVNMDAYATVTPIGATGWRVTYDLPGSEVTPDALDIVFDINVNGSTFDDSTVELTTTVTNTGNQPVDIGIRYQLDFQIAGDDGPTFAEVNPTQSSRITENTYSPPAFQAYRVEDNLGGGPTFSIFGTSSAYPGISPTPTAPPILQYASWSDAYAEAFDYTTAGLDVATGGADSAVLYYFGPTAQSPITLGPSQSVSVSESLFATPPVVQQEICDNGIDDDGDRLVDSNDPDCPQVTPTATPTATPTSPAATPAPTPTPTPTLAALPPTGGQPGSSSGFTWLVLAIGGLAALAGGALFLAPRLRTARNRRR